MLKEVMYHRLMWLSLQKKNPSIFHRLPIAELNFGAQMSQDEVIRLHRMAAIDRLRKKPFLIIDENTGEIFGRLAATLRQRKRDHKYCVQDLWLASQAVQKGFKLLTRNKKDFEDIPGVDLVVFA